jgi:hypothetical protein
MKISITIRVSDDAAHDWYDSAEDAPITVRKLQVVAPRTATDLLDAVKFGELVEECIASAVEEYTRLTASPGPSITARSEDIDAVFPSKEGVA